MQLRLKYSRSDLDVDYYPSLLTQSLAQMWSDYLGNLFVKGTIRTSLLFGDEGLVYRVSYHGQTKETLVAPWTEIPPLLALKNLLETLLKQRFTVAIVQCYPKGSIGIAPHRDKEMVPGTIIAGLSVGTPRTIQFTRNNYEAVSIPLASGSLYVMNPPTNDKWLHCITKQPEVKDVRYSITFRNY